MKTLIEKTKNTGKNLIGMLDEVRERFYSLPVQVRYPLSFLIGFIIGFLIL